MVDFLLSPFSFLTRDEVVFRCHCVPVFVLDGTPRSFIGTSSKIFGYYWTPTKKPGILSIRMPLL